MRVRLLYKRSQPDVDKTVDALERTGAEIQRLPSDSSEHIAELIGRSGDDRLIISGGDGMIHHAAQSLARTSIPVGIIPAGTGNDIARALAIPKSLANAARVALGPVRSLDLISITGAEQHRSYAVSVLTAGFSGVVTETANRITWAGGQLKYTLATLKCLPKLERCSITGFAGHTEFSILAFGNTRFFGGGMAICPDASPVDDRIDAIVVDAVRPIHLAAVLPAAFVGQHVRSRNVHLRHLREASIEVNVPWWADGEPLSQTGPVTITSVPGALDVATGDLVS